MSEIKVNKISPRTACGTTTLGDSGDTIAIPAGVASTIEGNVTLGSSGKTITIPAGATITNSGTAAGFGATGAASWDTTVKTTGFTAVSGVGYFVNTTAGAISVNLPAGSAGDVVAIKDYANTFDTNGCTLVQNGSDKIGGSTVNATLSTEGLAITLVFVDATQGWLVTDNGTQDTAPTAEYVTATGGTETTCGDYKIHRFTGPGTFCVSVAGNPVGSNTVDYLVVAGGGSSVSNAWAGGGGAGGYRESPGTASGYTASPLGAAPATAITTTVQGYPIDVGGGGSICANGSNSTALGITSTGGGKGGAYASNGVSGGSGGGGGGDITTSGGAGNTPSVSPAQGQNGGQGYDPAPEGGAGGGGAGSIGSDGSGSGAGTGGNGINTGILGSSPLAPSTGTTGPAPGRYFSGGAGGSNGRADVGGNSNAPGGFGGGGRGGSNVPVVGTPGTINTGGGGGAGPTAGIGGSGIVIIRYKFQN